MEQNPNLKKHKNWLVQAEKKHNDRLGTPIKQYEKFLDNLLPDQTTDKFQSHFNHYFLNVRKQVPELLGDITVTLKPKAGRETISIADQAFNNKRACMILENKVGSLYSAMSFKYDIKNCVMDLLVANHTGVLVGNDTEIEYNEVLPEEMQNVLNAKAENGEMLPGETIEPVKEISRIKKNEVVIKRISYQECYADPDSTEYFYNDGGFAIRKVKLTKEQAEFLTPDGKLDTSWETDTKSNEKNDAAKKYIMYEIYDQTGEDIKRYRYMGSCAKYIDEKSYKYVPLLMAKFNHLPDQTYVKSDLFYYKSAVEESDFYRTVAMNNLNFGSTPKLFAEKNTIDDINKDKLMNDIAYECVEVDTKGRGLDNAYKLEQFQPQDGNFLQAIDRATADIRELAQVNNERFNAKDVPATNATISNNAFMSGVEERKQILRDFIVNITKSVIEVLKEISIQQESFTYEQPNGVKEEVTWNNEDIQYVDCEIEVDINLPVADGVKLASIRDYANWITQPNIYMGLQAEGKKLNFTELVTQVGAYLMPSSNIEKLIVDSGMKSPEEEILAMMKGEQIAPQEGEDYQKHLDVHKAFLTTHPMAMTLPPEILKMLDAHIMATMTLAEQKDKLMQQQGQPMGGSQPAPNSMAGNVAGGKLG